MNRRRFLGVTGGVGAAALAGCLGVLDGGTGSGYGTVTKYTYTKDEGRFSVRQWSPATELELDEHVSQDLEARLAEDTAYTWGDVDPGTVDHEIMVSPGGQIPVTPYVVFLGSFDLDAARDHLEDASQATSTYQGFDVYDGITHTTSSGETTTVPFAVGDGAVIRFGGGFQAQDGSIDQLHRVIDAAIGSVDPVTAENDALAAAAERIRPSFSSTLEPWDVNEEVSPEEEYFPRVKATGNEWSIDGDAGKLRAVHVHESAEAASEATSETESEAPIDEWISGLIANNEVQSATYSVDGRIVEIEGPFEPADVVSE